MNPVRAALAAVASMADTWEQRFSEVDPDPAYSHNDPSQYAEGIVHVSAGDSAQVRYRTSLLQVVGPEAADKLRAIP